MPPTMPVNYKLLDEEFYLEDLYLLVSLSLGKNSIGIYLLGILG